MQTYKAHIPQFSLKKEKTEFPIAKITSSRDSFEFIRQFYFDDIDIIESFFILLLNQANNTIGYAKISQGGITSTVVDTRIIAKYAIEALATGVILAHNHPSGSMWPSEPDKRLTEKIKTALKLLDINVMDHIILSDETYYSFADNGMM